MRVPPSPLHTNAEFFFNVVCSLVFGRIFGELKSRISRKIRLAQASAYRCQKKVALASPWYHSTTAFNRRCRPNAARSAPNAARTRRSPCY
ncbi:hypothetical protein AXF42_Ash005514 [Apostasia shenzhenica]|uniref:Uncharacterized protein n=1 Tax=Apostasia shenzhenica TaxID=1088818 RepID=A0A2I0B754_9ASPA|nr:hypothetical protein AXF42_Ash005514 [Apostasia shenzhenica]